MIEVSRGSGVCAALCIRRTLCRHVTIDTPMVIFCCFDCLLTVFDEWYIEPIVKNTQNHLCTNRHRSTKTERIRGAFCDDALYKLTFTLHLHLLYQQCTNGVPIVKNSQKQPKDSQNSKNYHWCTNRHMSTKTAPTVYPNSVPIVKNS